MRKITIDEAIQILKTDNTYRKDVYLVLNKNTRNYFKTGKIGILDVCRIDRAQCNPNTLKADGFTFAFVD